MSPRRIVPNFAASEMAWRSLACPKSELRLDLVLRCGQSFRWSRRRSRRDGKDDEEAAEWVGALAGKAWLLRQPSEEHIEFKCFPEKREEDADSKLKDEEVLRDYFQLNVMLGPLYKRWAEADEVFKKCSESFSGIRILRQDPVENLFSFICSSNNHISRISSMVENLCSNYGEPICRLEEDAEGSSPTLFSFPTLSSLTANQAGMEKRLRQLGFGYRAAYIRKTASALAEKGGADYLMGLRRMEFDEARKELLQLSGVGPKVADCILLMSLDQPSSVPVDTHMFQIAAKKYLPHLRAHKSVTDRVYREVADHFRSLYGEHAGWAHSILFSADLKHLQPGNQDESTAVPKKKAKR